jgi:hypothetical protein
MIRSSLSFWLGFPVISWIWLRYRSPTQTLVRVICHGNRAAWNMRELAKTRGDPPQSSSRYPESPVPILWEALVRERETHFGEFFGVIWREFTLKRFEGSGVQSLCLPPDPSNRSDLQTTSSRLFPQPLLRPLSPVPSAPSPPPAGPSSPPLSAPFPPPSCLPSRSCLYIAR